MKDQTNADETDRSNTKNSKRTRDDQTTTEDGTDHSDSKKFKRTMDGHDETDRSAAPMRTDEL